MKENENLEEETKSPSEVVEKNRKKLQEMQNLRNSKISNVNLERATKKRAIKAGVPPVAREAGVPSAISEGVMDTDEGDEMLDEAVEQPSVSLGVTSVVSQLVSRTWLWIIVLGTGLFFLVFMIIVAFLIKNADNLNYAAGNFFANEEYKKLYAEVEEVVKEFQSKYNVKIDKYLIIATLTAYQDNEMYFDDTTSGAYDYINVEDEEVDSNGNITTISKSIDEMTAKIEILAKYQIMTTTSCNADSSTMRKIASNDDDTTIFNFWTSAASKEKNYNCSGGSGKSYSLSIEEGDIDDENSGSTFYWNLIDENFFKQYYPEYFTGIGDHKTYESHVAQVVEYIYLYAESLRELDCDNDNTSTLSTNFATVNTSCPQVTVEPDSAGQYGGNYQLEEYVAGVINDEAPPSYMSSIAGSGNDAGVKEDIKAFAIAVRSYTIGHTNGCTTSIRNSSMDQNFKPTDDALIWEAVNETAGLVLVKNDGAVLSAMYDSFMGNNNCNSSVCSYNYRKLPSQATHLVTIPAAWQRFAAGGHGYGLSQIAALDLAVNQHKNYQEIVKYFYDDDVQIQRLAGTSSSSGNSQTAYCQRTAPSENNNGTCDGKTIYREKTVGSDSLTSPMNLLSCTADQAEKAFKEISAACGKISHAGSIRSLNDVVSVGRSSTSLHYTGRAFDLDTTSGMQTGNTYFYVTKDDTSGNDNSHYYRLYCKVKGNSTNSHIKDTSIIPVYYNNGNVLQKTSISGKFLDVTAVFNDYGLYGIGPRSCSGNPYICTEWWHFQDTSGFVEGETTFKEALDQYYGQGYNYSNTPVSSQLNKKWNGGSFS